MKYFSPSHSAGNNSITLQRQKLIHRYVSYHCCLPAFFFRVQIAEHFCFCLIEMFFKCHFRWRHESLGFDQSGNSREREPLKLENCSRVKCFLLLLISFNEVFAWWLRADVITFMGSLLRCKLHDFVVSSLFDFFPTVFTYWNSRAFTKNLSVNGFDAVRTNWIVEALSQTRPLTSLIYCLRVFIIDGL